MTTRMFPLLGSACGALFSAVLFAVSGRHIYAVGLAALVLFLPFLAYLCSLLREAEGESGWLSASALAAGVTGITIKASSVVPDIAARQVGDGTPLHKALDDMAAAATVISLYPLAVLLGVVAILTARTGVLPRWLGLGAAVTAVALAINGSFIHAENMPGLLLFVLWTLIASVVLFRRAQHEPARATRATLAAS